MNRDRVLGLAVATGIGLRSLLIRRPRRGLAERLAMLPTTGPVSAPVSIHWNEHQIPFIEAENDADLAVVLGMVHAHLRLAQMEIMRRAAQGRVAEFVGPLGIELDRSLRLLDFGRAVPDIIAGLATDTRLWADGFVRGVNHVLAHLRTLPEEMRLLGIGREAWTLIDLFTSARLAAADVNWVIYGRLLRARATLPREAWRALWPGLVAGGMPNPETALAGSLARAGSNAAAVAAWRSKSGGALFAADPHLSVALPNIWLAAGMRSPTLNVVGLMPAGFPIVAIDRNPHIAWGGTSLHAAASDLFDVSGEILTEDSVTLRVRGAGTRQLTLRRSVIGPVVSDGAMLRNPVPLALRWVGHTPSDEIGAMLGSCGRIAARPSPARSRISRFPARTCCTRRLTGISVTCWPWPPRAAPPPRPQTSCCRPRRFGPGTIWPGPPSSRTSLIPLPESWPPPTMSPRPARCRPDFFLAAGPGRAASDIAGGLRQARSR